MQLKTKDCEILKIQLYIKYTIQKKACFFMNIILKTLVNSRSIRPAKS